MTPYYAVYYIDPDVIPQGDDFLVASKSGDSWGTMTAAELEATKAEARAVLTAFVAEHEKNPRR